MLLRDRVRDLAVSDTGFLFDPYTGLTFSLNGTGRFILERLKAGDEPDAIVQALAAAFSTNEADDPGRDVREFLLLMRDQGLVPRDETR
jgi:hypothetical protein